MRFRGFTFTELAVVMGILFVVMGVTVYKFKSERREQARQLSRVDKQASIRRFLMWFRQDMQSMDEMMEFRVQPNSRVVEIKFDRFIDEFDKQIVAYRYDFNRRKVFRTVENAGVGGASGRIVKGLSLENVLDFQIMPFDYDGQRISDLSLLRDNLYFFKAQLLFSDHIGQETRDSIRPFEVAIYPKLKSSANKAGFNSFYINRRFD